LHEHLTRTAMKGTFPISGRDLSVCGMLHSEEDTGILQFVTTSVVDPLIPESKKHVRSNLNFAGWRLEPHVDDKGNTTSVDVIYIVDIDIKLDSIPTSILKMLSNQIPTTISKIDELMQKTGFCPYVLKADTKILTEEFNVKNDQYDLTLLPESGCITEFKISKLMYPNGIDVSVMPENCKVELLPTSAETIRVTLPSKVTLNIFTITASKRSKGFRMTYNNGQEIPLALDPDSNDIPIRKDIPTYATGTMSTNATLTNNTLDEVKPMNPVTLASKINIIDPETFGKPLEEKINNVLINQALIPPETFVKPSSQVSLKLEAYQRIFEEHPKKIATQESREIQNVPDSLGVSPKEDPAVKKLKNEVIENNTITDDLMILAKSANFNSHQIGLMFASMVLAYYAGKLST
ncbi:14187_t:CDS:2, partial [Funneliformis mosseae]